MWIPRDTADIENAIAAGMLEETSTFDAKRELSSDPKHNVFVATDIAAMSTAGGVILIGVGEDDDKRLTVANPIALAGADDRISHIAQSSISEVPYIEFRRYELADDPTKGYLLVVVPPSPRAPHQVIVGTNAGRFYGRGAKGNRRLGEQEIAALYERRARAAVNLEERLAEAVLFSRFQPVEDIGYLYAFVQPVPPSTALWDAAVSASGGRDQLRQRLSDAIAATPGITDGHDPNFNGPLRWYPEGAEAWRLSTQTSPSDDPSAAMYTAEITMNIDGRAVLFSGHIARRDPRAYNMPSEQGRKLIKEG